jgi:hypothetical protein
MGRMVRRLDVGVDVFAVSEGFNPRKSGGMVGWGFIIVLPMG